jgi:hypothetical protein
MKQKLKQTGMALAAAFAALLTLLGGCGTAGATPQPGADIFADEQGSLQVMNDAEFDAVLFAGRPESGNLLGGIRRMSGRRFELSKIAGIPQKGAFILRAVSTVAYEQKNAAVTDDDVLYTGLVVYDLENPSRTVQKHIPRQIDGSMSCAVSVSNDSGMILEIHADSPDGPKLAALPPYARNMTLWLVFKPNAYAFFPAFIAVNPDSGETTVILESRDFYSGVFMMPEPVKPGRYTPIINFDSREKPESPVTLLFE